MSEPQAPSFEESLAELENIVRDLESGELSLDAALARYEQGVTLLRTCYGCLQQAEQKIQLLAGVDDDRRPLLEPFGHETSEARTESKRGRKRADPGS
jgi:exodeoxyribonuclease VII small subunit